MKRKARITLSVEARRRNQEQLARLGGRLRLARRRRRLTQSALGDRVGIARSTISAIERGHGGSHTLDAWQRLALALDLALVVELGRDPLEPPADAGHLAMQELVLRLGRSAGYRGSFELATRPSEPSRSADVGLRDDVRGLIVLVECWNVVGDVGAGVRATTRKLAEAEAVAIALQGEHRRRVAGCWVVRATRRNRELVARYPAIFAARFPGSSRRWVDALATGVEPPVELGLVWCDVGARRLTEWRRR